jgi:hypothetical protein
MSRVGAVVHSSKSATIRRLLLSTLLLSTLICHTQPTDKGADCLNLLPQEGTFSVKDHKDKCFRDQLGFANLEVIKNAEELFGLSPREVGFIGCDIAPYSARIDRSEPELHFEILYKSTDAQSASTIAILHELGHAYQLKHAGSRESLLASADQNLERVELGADYLSGLAVGRLRMSEKDFEVGLALVGSYAVHSGPHGHPNERSESFNYGVTAGKTSDSIASLYDGFQDDEYGHIKQKR